MKDNFIFYRSFYDAISKLPNKELKSDVFEAICELALYNNDIQLSSETGQMIMTLISPVIKANILRYENGKKGGRPPTKTNGYSKTKTNGSENKKPNKEVRSKKLEVRSKKLEEDKDIVYFENDELEKTFREFLEVRKKLKAVNSERAIKSLINKLDKYDDNTKLKVIEQSIVNSWKDVYELKVDKRYKSQFEKNRELIQELKEKYKNE